jgi:hypothetical protein
LVIRQIRLARVLIDGDSALNIIFTKTLEDMGFDMTKLFPSDQAFYGIISGAGSTLVGKVTLPVTFGTQDNYRTESIIFEGGVIRDFLPRHTCETSSRQVHGDSKSYISSLEEAGTERSPLHLRRHPDVSLL